MLFIPRATEKAYSAQTQNTYIFIVPRSASKQVIANQIESEFKVKVISVRTLVRDGKPTRFSRGRRAYPGTTFRQDQKYAYVTLAAGYKIPVFETAEDQSAAEPTTKDANNTAARKTDSQGDK